MTTLGALIDSIISDLHGQTNSQEQRATLLADITSTATSFQIDIPDSAGRGLYEIDDELVHVKSGSPTDGTMLVPAWGRGQNGSTAVAHTAGARVTRAPRFPRSRVKALVLEHTQQLYPDLYPVLVAPAFSASWVTPQYAMPASCKRVLAVDYQNPSLSDQEWFGIRRWKLNTQADTTQFPSGVALSLSDIPMFSATIRVTYTGEPVPLVNDSDAFTLTGFRDSVADLVRLGVTARLVVGPEVARGQITSVEQSERSQLVPTGSTTSVARYFQSLYERRLQSEQQALRERVPVRVVRTWV